MPPLVVFAALVFLARSKGMERAALCSYGNRGLFGFGSGEKTWAGAVNRLWEDVIYSVADHVLPSLKPLKEEIEEAFTLERRIAVQMEARGGGFQCYIVRRSDIDGGAAE